MQSQTYLKKSGDVIYGTPWLTPFWKAMEWIWMMLFRLRSRVSRRWRSQKIASGTEVRQFPERSRTLSDSPSEWRSSRFSSDMKLSEKTKQKKQSKSYNGFAILPKKLNNLIVKCTRFFEVYWSNSPSEINTMYCHFFSLQFV